MLTYVMCICQHIKLKPTFNLVLLFVADILLKSQFVKTLWLVSFPLPFFLCGFFLGCLFVFFKECGKSGDKAITDADDDYDDDSLSGTFDGWRLMWPALNCVRLHVFLCMSEDRLSLGQNGQGVTSTHTQSHAGERRPFDGWWYAVPRPSSWSEVQPWGSSGVPQPYQGPAPPRLAYYTSATSLLLFSLFSVFPPSLINVKPSNNKDAILSPPPASSAPRICHYALTLPHRQLCIHRHPFHMVPELEPKAHAANMKGCSEGARGREKSGEEAFLSL